MIQMETERGRKVEMRFEADGDETIIEIADDNTGAPLLVLVYDGDLANFKDSVKE